MKLAADGTFRISGVPPGEYDLAVAVYAKPSGCLIDPLARQVVRVSVTAADVARGELKVPEIAAEVVPIPAIGDTPTLTFKRRRRQGRHRSPTSARSTPWSTSGRAGAARARSRCRPSRSCTSGSPTAGLATLGLSLDDDAEAWKAAVKGLDLPWSQGRLGGHGAAGVSSVPTYWLLDPSGEDRGQGVRPRRTRQGTRKAAEVIPGYKPAARARATSPLACSCGLVKPSSSCPQERKPVRAGIASDGCFPLRQTLPIFRGKFATFG